jgi:3-oxoacyl-[acyl-carrier protein] reductase
MLAADLVSFDTSGEIQTGEIEYMNFSGKVALITGAGSPQGIGFATARLLAQQGSKIAITSTTERIEARARELAAEAGEVFAFPADLRDQSSLVIAASTSSSTTPA